MSVWVNVILWACILPLVPILYFMLKNECRPKKNIVVGVTLPYEAQRDPEVLALLERYKKELKRLCYLALLPAAPCLFVRSLAVSLTVWILWIFAAIAVLYIPYFRCHRAVKRLKEVRGWRRQPGRQAVADLTAAAESMRWLPPVWFLPPFLISLLPLAFERELWWLWALDAALVPLFYACYRWLYRNRSEAVDGDSGRTVALTRIRRYNWGKCWLILAWATGIFNLGLRLTREHFWACMAVCLAYAAVAVGAVLGVEFRVRRLQEKLTAGSGQGCYVDEDDRWLWGMLYYNPDDRRLTVNARVGVGTTVNLARRSGQVIMALIVVLVLGCMLMGPGLGWYLSRLENSPVELAVTETQVTAVHYHTEYAVDLADIVRAELMSRLPSMRRVSGTGMESVRTGRYQCEEWGGFTCCIDPRSGPWLLLETEDGRLWLFGGGEGAAEAAASALARLS